MSRNGKQQSYKAQSVKSKENHHPDETDFVEAEYQESRANDTFHKLLVILGVVGGNLLRIIKQIDWRKHSQRLLGGLTLGLKTLGDYSLSAIGTIHESIAPQYRNVTYVITALLIAILPLGIMLIVPNGDNLASSNTTTYDLPISQQGSPPQSQTQLAPFFSPTVQYWSDDIIRWSETRGLDANYLATIIQIESCGNPLYMNGQRLGLFAVAQSQFLANDAFNDVETNAQRAIERLQQGRTLTQNDLDMTLAYYHAGDNALQSDFTTWTLEMRDNFIFGRGIYHDAQRGFAQSEFFNQWFAAHGESLCQQASMTLDMTTG